MGVPINGLVRKATRKVIPSFSSADLLVFTNPLSRTPSEVLENNLSTLRFWIDEEALACFSPYQTEHINRFGRYALKRDRMPEPLDRVKVLRMPPRSEGLPATVAGSTKYLH